MTTPLLAYVSGHGFGHWTRSESVLAKLPDPESMSELWEAEWRSALTRAAFAELRGSSRLEPRTLRAFEMLALEGPEDENE